MWLASGIPEAFYYVGWHAEQVRSSINAVSKRGVQLCVLAHRLWHEAMTLVSDIDEAFSQVYWQVESGIKPCSWLVGFLTIRLASQSDMTLSGKLSF